MMPMRAYCGKERKKKMNKCPKCKYNFVRRMNEAEVKFTKNTDATKMSKWTVTKTKAKGYECRKCGWSKLV